MCGIAGLFWKNPSGRRLDDFRSAARLLSHRGPDSCGEFLDERGLLIHYRLAILDLSPAGHQPFQLPIPKASVGVYNGELYNFRELANRLVIDKETTCDTEVVFKSLAQHGMGVLGDFNGIFSLAHYQVDEQNLYLARDRLGVKPLYYLDSPDCFAFASEAKVLYAFMQKLYLQARAVREFLAFGSSMSMQTIVKGVRKLPPGTFMKLDLNDFQTDTNRYWRIGTQDPQRSTASSYKEARTAVTTLLTEAVGRQCMSDVPIGAYLSGGLDSSMVVALAAPATSSPIRTFSVEFEGSSNSELPLARQVAKRYATDHHELKISPNNLVDDLNALIIQYDEPFADPAALPLHLMAQQCAAQVKVILQGDGGDELFGGYGRHLDISQFRRRWLAFGLLGRLHPQASARKGFKQRFEALSARPLSLRLAKLAGFNPSAELGRILKGHFGQQITAANPLGSFEQAAEMFSDHDRLSQVLLTDMMTILPHTFLEKVDKVSMWHGIEARVPFLDHALVDYMTGLPSHYKIRNGVTKALLRDIARDFLPNEVVSGRKQSFGTPMSTWLGTLLYDYAQGVFHRSREKWSEHFDFDHILRLHQEHAEGRSSHSGLLWRLVVLLIWLEYYGDKVHLTEDGTVDSGIMETVQPCAV